MSLNSSKYASGFSPQNIPGLVVWLDAADSNAVTQSAGVVSYWRDKSPSPVDVSQNTVGARPTYESNVQNGLPAVRFTTSQMMQSASNFTLDRGQTWFVSFKALATGNIFFVEQGPNTNTTNGQFLYGGNNSLMYMTRSGTSRFIDDPAGRGTTPFSTNVWYVCGFVTSNNSTASTDVYWSINGASRTCAISGTVTGTATNQLYINNTARVPGSNYMGEILIYNWAMPSNQVRLVERYLAYKWGVTLPTQHPFSSTPATLRSFNPLDIPGCSLWLDAADYSTLTFSSGSNVSQWNDKSGNGYNATAFNSPTYSTFNGNLNGITLNGSSTYFYYSNAGAMNTTSNLSAFVVAQAVFPSMNAIGWSRLLSFGDLDHVGVSNAVAFERYSNVNQLTYERNVTPPAPALTFGSTVSFVGSVVFNSNGVAHRINGASNSFTSGSTGAFNYSLYNIGRHSGGGPFHWAGMICEAITYNASLDSNQVQQVELYLAEKWNLRTSLSTSNAMRLYESLSPVFNPTLLSNCTLWLDAGDAGTMSFTGSNLTTWRDKSGVGNNGTATGTITNTGSINGTSVPQWTGATFKCVSGTLSNTTTTLSTFAVFNMSSSSADFSRILGFTIGTEADWTSVAKLAAIFKLSGTPTGYGAYRGSSPASSNVTSAFNVPIIASILFDGTNNILYVNGVAGVSSTNGSGGAFGYNTYVIGGELGTPTVFTEASIAEVIHYPNFLPTQQRRLVEGYLAWKWGLVGSLPSTHPYKKTPV
jgi:hypothetical protein